MIALEVSVEEGLHEMIMQTPQLLQWARLRQSVQDVALYRFWHDPVACHIYHTIAAVDGANLESLDAVAEVFLHANQLETQPWYPAFISGNSQPLQLNMTLPEGVEALYTGQAVFDFGLVKPRYYNQLIADIRPEPFVRIIAMRSIEGLSEMNSAVQAYTLSPSADVFVLDGNRLLWHHIVTVHGASLLPPRADYLLMRILRTLHLDFSERKTYLEEATAFRQCFVQGVFSDLLPGQK